MISFGVFLVCVGLVSLLIYEKIKVHDLKNDKLDLQLENSDLIERNQKLDEYLDQARVEAVKANHKLMKLEYTEEVYLVMDQKHGVVYGVFREIENATRFIDGDKDMYKQLYKLSD